MPSMDDPALCPGCGREIDESRAVETNYLLGTAGEPGGAQDWYACAGCLSAFRITWEPERSIGDDAWRMFPTKEILISGAAVVLVIERLRAAIADGEPKRALSGLRAAPDSARLMRIPEVVAAAAPAFGGRAVAASHLGFAVTTIPKAFRQYNDTLLREFRVAEPVVQLRELEPAILNALLLLPDDGGIRKPTWESPANASALVTQGTRLVVTGSGGPFVHAKPANPLWQGSGELEHFRVTLERLAPDPDAP